MIINPAIKIVLDNPSDYRGVIIDGSQVKLVPTKSRKKVTYTSAQLVEQFESGLFPVDVALVCSFDDVDKVLLSEPTNGTESETRQFTFSIPVHTTIVRTINADSLEEAFDKLQDGYFWTTDVEDFEPDLDNSSLMVDN